MREDTNPSGSAAAAAGSAPAEAPTGARAPQVFISYAWDSEEHREHVRDLWVLLRANGIDAQLDIAADNQRRDWTLWMEQQVTDADFIIIVASPAYQKRAGPRPSRMRVGVCSTRPA